MFGHFFRRVSRNIFRNVFWHFGPATLLLSAAAGCFAQSLGTGDLNGSVADPQGLAVAGASVTVTSLETGLVRRTTSGSSGQFSVPVLPPGEYTVRVEKERFAAFEQNTRVTVGATTRVVAALRIGTVNEAVNVQGERAPLDITKTEEYSVVDRTQIDELPINGRRVDQFALLTPGVTRDGTFGDLSYHGMSGFGFNNFMVEGNDDNQAYNGGARGFSRISLNISANAVREFQVGQSNFLPEFGRAAGGSVNAVVRSGSNHFHADAFWYYRDQSLNAKDPFATFKPTERRQQFGGSAGGPLIHNKLFLFVNYDQQIRDVPQVTQDPNNVLTANRPTTPGANQTAFDTGAAYLASKYPGGAPGGSLPRNFNHNNVVTKIDWNVNAKNTLSGTYTYHNHRALNGIFTSLVTDSPQHGNDDVRLHTINLRLTTIVSNRAVNEVRAQWSRDFEWELGGDPPPTINVSSISVGIVSFLPRFARPDERRHQLVENFSYATGKHTLKFGGDLNRVIDTINEPRGFGGAYTYSTVLAFGRDLVNPAGRNYSSFTQSFGLPGISFGVNHWSGFAQDQWRGWRRLTLNYGLRYDYQRLPPAFAPNPAIPETQRLNQDRTNWGPRAGVAFALTNNTVLRGGYGIFYARTPSGLIDNALRQTGLLDPAKNTLSVTLTPTSPGAPIFPNILAAPPATATANFITRLDAHFQRPRAQQVNVGVERQVHEVTFSASYLYTKGDRLPLNYDTNLQQPNFRRTYQLPDGSTFEVPFVAGVLRAPGATANRDINLSRPNPNFGRITVGRSIGESWYHGMLLEARSRMRHGVQYHVAYTLSQVENYAATGSGIGLSAEGAFGGSNVLDQFDLDFDRGRAPNDHRHRLVTDAVWNIPSARGASMLAALARNYKLSGILHAESGRAFSSNISVPNIPFTTPDGTWWNGYGGLLGQGGLQGYLVTQPRNPNTGDANYRLDLRFGRDLHVNERVTLQLLGEGFNVFNRRNVNQYNTTAFNAQTTQSGGSNATPAPLAQPVKLNASSTFGIATGDNGFPDGTNARRFQFAVRVKF